MTIDRRRALEALFGTGLVGLRALATGLPASWLLRPRDALAAGACPGDARAQYLVLNTSAAGDPINNNCPGSYAFANIDHPADPRMAKGTLTLGGKAFEAALPWTTLPQDVLDRTCFFHHGTYANAHPSQGKVMRLMGGVERQEMLVSLYAQSLAPCLGTAQSEPVSVGAVGGGELLTFRGRTLPKMAPLGLKAVLARPRGALAQLQALRDRDLDRLNALFKQHGNATQRAYLDRLALSQREARSISDNLLGALSSITRDDADNQCTAAAALIKMNVTPVVSLHIPFGGDNHFDTDLSDETDQTISGMATLGGLMKKLKDLDLQDRVTFASLNVFGRNLIRNKYGGREHWGNHHVTVMIGKHVRPGVIGGLEQKRNGRGDYHIAQAIDSKTGAGSAGGDIPHEDTLNALGKTLGAALGVPSASLEKSIATGKVVGAAIV